MMKRYKKNKESFGSKFTNLLLTIVFAIFIGSQVCTAANQNLRFAQVSDVHFSSFEENTSYKFLKKSEDLLNDAILQINTSGPYDFVMFTGDLVNKPKESELVKFTDNANKLVYPWHTINGNHDIAIDGPLTKKRFLEVIKSNNKHSLYNDKLYYAFTPKNGFRVICLDSIIDYKLTSNGEIPQEELTWLRNELESNKNNIIIICTHVPIMEPFSSANHKLLNDNEVYSLLRKYNNPILILQGHYHTTKIKQHKNIIAISTPSLVTYPNAFRVININNNKKRTLIDIYLKETNLKEIQTRSKLRILGTERLYGEDCDRNISIEIRKDE